MPMRVSLLGFWVCKHSQHLKLCTDSMTEEIKTSRATINNELLCLCRHFLDVLINLPDDPVCRLSRRRKQCDATNLGCLMQTIAELSRPQAEDCLYRGTVTDLLSNIRSIPWYGARFTYNRPSHAGCGVSQKMSDRVAELMTSVRCLSLPS